VGRTRYNVLAAGLDSLVVGFGVKEFLDSPEWANLAEAKEGAKASLFAGRSVPVSFFGKDFALSARGSKGWEYVLNNNDMSILVAKEAKGGTVYPEVYTTFRAEYLWRVGSDGAFREVSNWLDSFLVQAYDKVSRADLAVDLDMPLPRIDVFNDIISASRNKVVYSEVAEFGTDRRVTNYRFGSGDLLGRFYDKSFEVVKLGKEFIYPVWRGNGWDGASDVSRLEFQVRREKLKEFGADTFFELRKNSADMWRYFTTHSLRVCESGAASDKGHWKVKPYWQDLADAVDLFGVTSGVLPFKQYKGDADRLLQQALGCNISAFARLSAAYGEDKAVSMMRDKGHLAEDFIGSDDFLTPARKRASRFKYFSHNPIGEDDAVFDVRAALKAQGIDSEIIE